MHFSQNDTLATAWHWFMHELSGRYEPGEARSISNEVFWQLLGIDPVTRVMQPGQQLSESAIGQLKQALEKLKQHMPVQYVTGLAHFLELELEVNPRVLIPRGETEELVLWIKETLQEEKQQCPLILDIGSGSGCIAISLARYFPAGRVIAADLEPGILDVVARNAAKNKASVELTVMDVLQDEPVMPVLDVVVSNPPYVREQEKNLMKPNVLEHEPARALYVPDHDPLVFYRAIARRAYGWLRSGGYLFFEINEFLGPETLEEVKAAGFIYGMLRQDLHGRDRLIRAVRS